MKQTREQQQRKINKTKAGTFTNQKKNCTPQFRLNRQKGSRHKLTILGMKDTTDIKMIIRGYYE